LASEGELFRVQEAHATHFLSLAEQIEPREKRDTLAGENVPGTKRLHADHENLRAALTWFADHERPDLGLRLAGALDLFRALGDPGRIATELTNLAISAHGLEDRERAAALAEEAIPLWRNLGNDWGLGFCLRLLGDVACDRREITQAAAYFAESQALAERDGDQWSLADTMTGYAALAIARGEPMSAARLLGAAEALYRELGLRIPPPDRLSYARLRTAIYSALGDAAESTVLAGQAMPLAVERRCQTIHFRCPVPNRS
jgi:tetratricopeptide (TPR) repeat protein